MVSEIKETGVLKASDLEYSEQYNHDRIKLYIRDLFFIRLMQMSTILTVSAHTFVQIKTYKFN